MGPRGWQDGPQVTMTYAARVFRTDGTRTAGYRATTRCRFLEGPGATSGNRKKMQPQLTGAHTRLSVHVLGILNHAMEEHRPNRDSKTPNSLLRAMKLCYLMPALIHSPDGQTKTRQRFTLVESGDIVALLPRLTPGERSRDNGMPSKKHRRRRSSNRYHRYVATQE